MFKQIFDRLIFALMGFAFGAVLAVVLWYLYGLLPPSHHYRLFWRRPEFDADLTTWIKYVGGFFAAIGFVFKERVGDAMGDSLAGVYDDQAHWAGRLPSTLTGIALLVLIVLAIGKWPHFS